MRREFLDVRALEPRLFSYLYALAGGATLGESMECAGMDGGALSHALGFIFAEELVVDVALKSHPDSRAS
jgi:hypothetical protein